IIEEMKKYIEILENTNTSVTGWLAAFGGVVLVRFLLETFSSPSSSFPAAPDGVTMAHYLLFFFGLFISLVLIIRIFVSGTSQIAKALLFGFPIIWIPPILDLIYSNGKGYVMAYIFFRPQD